MCSEDDDIQLVYPIPGDDYPLVIEHLRNNFFPDEPLNKSVGLSKPGEPNIQLEEHTMTALAHHYSVLAVQSEPRKVVGVALNGILHKDDMEHSLAHLHLIDNEKYKTIFSFLYKVNIDLDLFNKYETDQIFEMRMLSVDDSYRGRGIAAKLIEYSIRVARLAGFRILKADCTGLYSQKIFSKYEFDTIFETKYEDHTTDNGELIFKTDPPHVSLKIMIKTVEPLVEEGEVHVNESSEDQIDEAQLVEAQSNGIEPNESEDPE